jgi:hypothetical protein
MIKGLTFRVVAVASGVVITALALEVVLQLLPVSDAQHRLAVNDADPVLRFEPNRSAMWSRKWNFELANRTRTNNAGFVCDFDYDASADSPLLAIIGDSYVEAVMVPFVETGMARMAEALRGDGARAYAFGVAGAPLSQYLAYAEHTRDRYRPRALAIVVVGNDFDESLLEYKSTPGYHYFTETSDGKLVLQRVDFEISLVKRLARKSALVRYILIHLELTTMPRKLRGLFSKKDMLTTYVGNTFYDADSTRVADSRRVVDAFLDELPARSGLAPSRILLVLDGMRPHLYGEETLKMADGSYVDLMRRYLSGRAVREGYEVIDMQPQFIEHFERFGRRFESFPVDAHWNSLGHELFFEAMMRSQVVKALRADGEGR